MNLVPVVKKHTDKIVKPVMKFYILHQSAILTGGTIGFSLATTVTTIRNARGIIETIDTAKQMIAEAKDDNEKHNIYVATIKRLAPQAIPIIIFQSATIACAITAKKQSDKKISNMTEALTLANNAIAGYKAFQKEAEEALGEEKAKEVKDAVNKEEIAKNPQTESNTANDPPIANQIYKYWDDFASRYFYSTQSPSQIRERVQNLSIALDKGDINQQDSAGRNYVTYNDIYRLIDAKLKVTAGDDWGWYDDRRGQLDESTIDIEISPIEDPKDPDSMVWVFRMYGDSIKWGKRW